jgi:phosphatidylglycerol:prolipoprotein diacylglycerol transferase
MLPVLFTIVLPLWGAYLAVFALGGLAGVMNARGLKNPWGTIASWTAGGAAAAVVLFRFMRAGVEVREGAEVVVVPLHTYGLMIASAFMVAIWLASREAKKRGLDPDRISDMAFYALIAGMVGSRIHFIIVNWKDYARDPAAIFAFWKGGLVWQGGLLAAFAVCAWYVRKHKLNFYEYADAIFPAIAVGHAMGRIGCFAAGCCWGDACPTDFALGVQFPPESLAFQSKQSAGLLAPGATHTEALHPVQLYEVGGDFVIFGLLTLLRPHKKFSGQVMLGYFILYPILRSITEVLRGDYERGMLFKWPSGDPWILSQGQFVSILMLVGAVAWWVILARKPAPAAEPAKGKARAPGTEAA